MLVNDKFRSAALLRLRRPREGITSGLSLGPAYSRRVPVLSPFARHRLLRSGGDGIGGCGRDPSVAADPANGPRIFHEILRGQLPSMLVAAKNGGEILGCVAIEVSVCLGEVSNYNSVGIAGAREIPVAGGVRTLLRSRWFEWIPGSADAFAACRTWITGGRTRSFASSLRRFSTLDSSLSRSK